MAWFKTLCLGNNCLTHNESKVTKSRKYIFQKTPYKWGNLDGCVRLVQTNDLFKPLVEGKIQA